jgi:hypothetical protein
VIGKVVRCRTTFRHLIVQDKALRSAEYSSSGGIGFVRKSDIPAAKQRALSSAKAFAVSARIGVLA